MVPTRSRSPEILRSTKASAHVRSENLRKPDSLSGQNTSLIIGSGSVPFTESGLALKQDLVRTGDQINETVLNGFSAKEEKVLYTLIKRVILNLDTGED